MATVGAFEAKTKFSALLERAERGEQIVITRRGKPVAKLVRIEKRAKAGSIVVLHANGKGKHTRQVVERLTADILPRKGLKPTTVSDLLSCKPVNR